MLTVLNAIQLVLYIALLALLGQGVLYVLAGARRESNTFYKLLQVLSRPFTWAMRRITPKQIADQHVPLVTFLLLSVFYVVVTFERADLCVTSNMVGQAGCR
jgi:type III secretory pathway component EscU